MYRTFVYYGKHLLSHALLTAAVLAAAFNAAGAADRAAAKSKSGEAADREAIRAAADSYTAAYNRGDTKAVARHWSDKGQWIGPDGKPVEGRAASRRN